MAVAWAACLGMGGGSRRQPCGGKAGTPIEIEPQDFDDFEQLLGEIQQAYSNEDLSGLRSRATPEMVSYFADDLADNASRGVVNKVSDVKLLQGDLAEAWREGRHRLRHRRDALQPDRPDARPRDRAI